MNNVIFHLIKIYQKVDVFFHFSLQLPSDLSDQNYPLFFHSEAFTNQSSEDKFKQNATKPVIVYFE